MHTSILLRYRLTIGFLSAIIFSMNIQSATAQQLPAIQKYLNENKEQFGLSDKDITGWFISNQYTEERTGITYNYLQQHYKNIPVFNAIAPVLIRNGKAYGLKPPFVADLENKINADQPTITPQQAIQYAFQHLELNTTPTGPSVKVEKSGKKFFFNLPAVASSPVTVELMYVPTLKGVKLAWNVNVDLKNGSHWWNVRVDALTGQYLEKNDWVVSCGFEGPHDHSSHAAAPSPQPQPMPGSGTAQYNVFPLPVESPIHGPRQLLNDPSEPVPSPYGWHDTNGATGVEYNITRGNNVYAYEDANNDNLPGYSPDGGALQIFNFPYHPDSSNAYQRDASITNLFYMNNMIHDVLYQHGFNEVAGNFQSNNYGNGGLGNDYVNAEGLDGGGTNNANFATPDDGSNPRMQMYLWSNPNSGSCTNSLNVNAPVAIAGLKSIAIASYNPASAFNITADVVLAQDGVGTSSDGCTAFTNAAAIAGKIALIDRGTCSYFIKTQFAQDAGAIGVIIANNVAGSTPPGMTGAPTQTITIPTVSVTQTVGTSMKTELNNAVTVNATLVICPVPSQLDGSFDNGIVAHEYGHGVSNRLTGGPAASSCLQNAEQGGEGWSDWLGLILTIEPGDLGTMGRGIGTYALGQATTGQGIRRYRYSTDMNINPQTYANLATSSTVHQRGEIWCDAIWDMTWFLIRDFGFSTNLYTGTAGNNVAMRLVLEGMKLQPCSPGYIDARDAILLADDILYNNAHRCQIWEAFARRGMGYFASQGSSGAVGDETVDFTYPSFCLNITLPPIAAFTAVQTTASCPASIKFNDTSLDIPQTWSWDFGDGGTSSQQNPTHIYTQPGQYTVRLIVSNTLGADTSTVVNYITITSFTLLATATPDSICTGDTVQLSALPSGSNAITNYNLTSIPYAPLTGTGTAVTLTDDVVTTALPIGFTFNFYGNLYTDFYISSNGFIGFSSNMANGCCAGGILPSASSPSNLIAFAWNDLNPGVNASVVDYFTTGVAPSRKLVVRYNTNHFNGTAFPMRGQIILSEGSNEIEIHSEVISSVSGAPTTQGIENAAGNMFVTPTGRNSAIFSAANDAWRFTPYATFGYSWSPNTSIDNAAIATPVAWPATTTAYTVQVTDPNGCIVSQAVPVHVSLCLNVAALNLRTFIEGFKNGAGTMRAVLFDNGQSANPMACDSITVSLRNTTSPYAIAYSENVELSTTGYVTVNFPPAALGNSYYIVVELRNGLETWSKLPVTMGANTSFDFTTP
jgi:PKD repeat protein